MSKDDRKFSFENVVKCWKYSFENLASFTAEIVATHFRPEWQMR